MNPNLIEAKNIYAKLLSSQDITVIHDNRASTASFNMVTRVLTLPVWKVMSNAIYVTLIGHEIGHAKFTPGGTHGAPELKAIAKKGIPFSYYNIIEDARIEKLIKRGFVGLNQTFKEAYNEIYESGQFGIKYADVNSLSLIDRLNMYAKFGHIVNPDFNKDELAFVQRLLILETWEDVCSLVEDVYNYSKSEAKTDNMDDGIGEIVFTDEGGGSDESQVELTEDMKKAIEEAKKDTQNNPQDDFSDLYENEEKEESNEEMSDGSGEESNEEMSDNKVDDSEESGDGSDTNPEEDDLENSTVESPKDGSNGSGVEEAETDNILEDYSDKQARVRDYGNRSSKMFTIGEATQEEIDTITQDISKVINGAKRYISDTNNTERVAKVSESLRKFEKDNQKYIDAIYSQFEMKKSADIMSRVSQHKTGILDPVKMLNYKTTDDIFSKKSVTPTGKNHTVTLMVDYSGSMDSLIYETTQQLFILMDFCRKANVPFEVYTWSDVRDNNSRLTLDVNQLNYSYVCSLRKIFSSEMSDVEYNLVKKYMYIYAKGRIDNVSTYGMSEISVPSSSTPIAAAYYYGGYLAESLRRKTNSQVGNMIMISDGGGYNLAYVFNGRLNTEESNIFTNQVKDIKTGKYHGVKENETQCSKMLTINRDRYPNVNITGFYASSNKNWLLNAIGSTDVCLGIKRSNSDGELAVIRKSIRERGAVEMKAVGYDAYYMFHATRINNSFNPEKDAKHIKRGKSGRINVNSTYSKLSAGSFGSKRVILSKVAEKISATA